MSIQEIVALVTGISALVLGLAQVRKGKADMNAVDVDTLRDLVKDVTTLKNENVKIQKNITDLDTKNQALWQYVYQLIEFIKGHGMIPPSPPVELETDPKLMKLFATKKQ